MGQHGLRKVLIANRGEIAIRIARAAAGLGIATVCVHSEDDTTSLHTRAADEARPLRGTGPAAYLDGGQLIALALETGCDAVHPGYGFLSEVASFAQACADAGLVFVGPRPDTLALFGDKVAAREAAARCEVPVLRGTNGATDASGAHDFLASLGGGAMVIKALAGGGGRGIRVVRAADEIVEAIERCRSEALASFGNGDVFAEELLAPARHIEVQIAGDGTGRVVSFGERECSIQRRHQKLVEIAPCPGLPDALRSRLVDAAMRLATSARYTNLGTFEFLVDATLDPDARFAFIEANPRLQVEHTVTEEVMGIDLVQLQLQLAAGGSLEGLPPCVARGCAIQLRINTETIAADGSVKPTGGQLLAFDLPGGPGVRTDTFGYAGYTTNPRFDSLLAKIVVHRPGSFADVVGAAARALAELRIDGCVTNRSLLQALLADERFARAELTTTFLDDNIAALLDASADPPPSHHFAIAPAPARAGARVDGADPLAVLAHGKEASRPGVTAPVDAAVADGARAVLAPMQGTIVSVAVNVGDAIGAGQPLLVMEAMKMEHVIVATVSGFVRSVLVSAGDTVFEGHAMVFIEPADVRVDAGPAATEIDLDAIRPDLAEVLHRQSLTRDAARPDAVARRRKTGQRTTRENVADLCDPGSFVEYGSLAIAAQRSRRPLQELIERTPADGMVAGFGRVNGDLFADDAARCVVMSYDYTVLAGTQGLQNHRKKDRLFELAERAKLPVVIFTEGGGGRPGDTDGLGMAGLDCMAFALFAGLSGLVPLVGINSGRCFAGNAALLGCCDVVIATANSSIGMGGPAMIEGGGLGVFHPDEVGPMSVQVANGVVDIPVADEAEAVAVAKQYLSYFQGAVAEWTCADQRLLRSAIPENRLRVYDIRHLIDTLADSGSVLELRRAFAPGMITSLARIEGRSIGIVANNPNHLAGAIDSDGADKAARFLQLCDAFDIPVLYLCDTPGMMVGPEIEKTALVRHCSRMFVVGASLTVPFFTIVLRKGYGLGAQAMAGGSFKAGVFTIAWPTGEFGGMGLEGAVKLGYRNDLAAIEDPAERKAAFDRMVARAYEHGKALNTASHFEIDDVIDPAESRHRIVSALRAMPAPIKPTGKKRPCIDTW